MTCCSAFLSAPVPSLILQSVIAQQHSEHIESWQQRDSSRHPTAGALQFRLAASRNNAVMLPFARLSAKQPSSTQPMFTLCSTSVSSGNDNSEDLSPSATPGVSSGYRSDTEKDSGSDSSSDLHVDKIDCQICQGSLASSPRKRRFLSLPWQGGKKSSSHSSSSSHTHPEFLVCDCCQRCYHKQCCKQRGISTKHNKGGVWFHSSSCEECLKQLQAQVASGATALPGGRSWQLIDCAPVDTRGPGGAQALKAMKQHMSDVLDVMLPVFGPGAAQQLVDTTKGYAVLLKKGSEPVTAGLMDVYGKDLAVLDFVATAMEHAGQGHCRTLLQALEGWLGPQLGVSRLVAVCPADDPQNSILWQQKFGYKKLDAKGVHALQRSIPALHFYEDSMLLAKTLKQQSNKGRKQTRSGIDATGKHESAAGAPDRTEGQQQQPAEAEEATSMVVTPLKV